MAGRGGTGVGAVVTIAIMGLLVLGLFVATLVFYTQNNKTQTALNEANAALSDYVRESERQQDRIRGYLDDARGENKSVVMHLADSLEAANRIAVGSPRLSTDALRERVGAVEGVQSSNLLAALNDRDNQIRALSNQLAAADAARQQALRDMATTQASVNQIRSDFERDMTAANERINFYGQDIETYLEGIRNVENLTRDQVVQLQNEYAAEMAEMNANLAHEREQNLILRGQLRALSVENQNLDLIQDAAALVDGRIAAINPADREVTIDIGRQQKVTLGMTFTVYGSADQISVDPATGNYTRGKATVEVIRIGDRTATARVLTERQGNPIVRSDVIVNAIYDPNKVFKFVVYGNFDANRDGVSTPGEADDLIDMIRRWGGQVVDDLAPDVDFVILGSRPVVPPPPPSTADIPVLSEWQRLDRMAKRYDDLFNNARDSAIPVLNQNRLFYLIGQ
jgi:hypothetical protein